MSMARLSQTFLVLSAVLLLFSKGARADAGAEARAAFERGVEASRAERWEDARREFQASRELVVKPSTLFNLAVADLKLGLLDEALASLDAFQALANPRDHGTLIERAAGLRAESERAQEAARPALERARGLLLPRGLDAEAQRSFIQGREAYGRGDDPLALESLQRAHAHSGRDELLYDIGVVADRMREDDLAIRSFDGFVSAFPDLPEADLARRHLTRLRQLQQEKSRPAADALIEDTSEATAAPPPKAPARAKLTLPRALIGLGAVLVAGAVGSALWWDDRAEARDLCSKRADECTNADVVTRQTRAAMATTLVLGAGGLSLLTASSVSLAKAKRGAQIDAVALTLGPRALAGHVRLRF